MSALTRPCVLAAWERSEAELRRFLRHRLGGEAEADDRLAITLCDLQGLTQQALAERLGLSLAGAKSRVQRARARLRARLVAACQVQFDETGRVCCHTPRTTGGDGS